MKNPDQVFRELGQLYEFQKQLKTFQSKDKKQVLEDDAENENLLQTDVPDQESSDGGK